MTGIILQAAFIGQICSGNSSEKNALVNQLSKLK